MNDDHAGPGAPASTQLDVAFGFTSERGQRPTNDDYLGVFLGRPEQRARHGIVASIADGMGGADGGRLAAETAVRGFVEGYVGESPTVGVKRAGTASLAAINSWIHALGRTDAAALGMATTFTALVLRGRVAHVLHVGDTRLYRLRDGRLARLTVDHAQRPFDSRHVLTRAVGLAEDLLVDYAAAGLQAGDRFLMCSDGLHGVLPDKALAAALAEPSGPEETARRLVARALEARAQDNVSALVIDVVALPQARLGDVETAVAALPIVSLPKVGDTVDGYRLERIVADGRYARIFRATDGAGEAAVIAKFPKPKVGADAVLRQAFVREHWIASLVRSPWLGEGLAREQTCLYALMPWYEGETLETRLTRAPPLSAAAGLDIAVKLVKGVAALHRRGIIHRDIKPENVILERNGGVRLIDLGVARVPELEEFPDSAAPGTPNYMAPEMFAGAVGDQGSDIFALGVTLFRMFSGAYPFAEAEAFARPTFKRAAPLSTRRPDLPGWLARVLERACAPQAQDRPGDTIELLFDLENGQVGVPARRPEPMPFYARNPVLVWKIVSALLAAALAAALLTGHWQAPAPLKHGAARTPGPFAEPSST